MVPVVPSMREWLAEIRLEGLYGMFKNTGFDDVESLYLQIFCQLNPLSDQVLEKEVKIEKAGYRNRILAKLKDDGLQYLDNVGLCKRQVRRNANIDTSEGD
jgi:hypothetical protein